jgi:hypothetical protein
VQKTLLELVPDKNIGTNALRSIYTSYWLPTLIKNQTNRVATRVSDAEQHVGYVPDNM